MMHAHKTRAKATKAHQVIVHLPSGFSGGEAEVIVLARLAALMHVHGIRHVLTFNLDDFKNLPDVVAIEPGVPSPDDCHSSADGGHRRSTPELTG
jgi:hypothetical protein